MEPAGPSDGRDARLRPHVRLLVVAAIGFALTLVLVVGTFSMLGGVQEHLIRVDARYLPNQTRLQRVEAMYERAHTATFSLQAAPNQTALGPQQYAGVTRSRDADSNGATAWSEYVHDAAHLDGEPTQQADFLRARTRYSATQIAAMTALIAGDTRNGAIQEYHAGYTGMRAALERLQELYARAERVEAHDARVGVATTRWFVVIEFAVGLTLFLTVFVIAFVSLLRRERRLAVQAAHHEREVGRAQLESDLQRAFEMVRSEDEAYRIIGDALTASVDRFDVELLVADSSRAHFRRTAGNTEPPRPGCPVGDPRECPATSRTQTMRFPHSDDLATCPYLRDRPDRPACGVCIPVTIAGKSVGVLHATGDTPEETVGDGVDTLELIARKAGDRLGTLRAFARTEAQARTDPLTGLLNRRSLENEVQELIEDGRPYVVAYGDVDHFKALNDLYGHDTGDRALRLFARVLRDSVRPADIPARYGGEEFVVVLPECRTEDAVAVVERFRERLAIELANGQLPAFTVSFGVAAAAGENRFGETVDAADAALLSAKAAGRNRVVAHPADDGAAEAAAGLDLPAAARPG